MNLAFKNFSNDLLISIDATHAAGEAIRPLHGRKDISLELKADKTDVTEADFRSDTILKAALVTHDPLTPVLSEETVDEFVGLYPVMPPACWIIDPLDGTRVFMNGGTSFLVMMVKMENFTPKVSVIHQPATGETYFAEKGIGAFKMDSTGNVKKLWRTAPIKGQPLRQKSIGIYACGNLSSELFYDDPVIKVLGQEFSKASGYNQSVDFTYSLADPHFKLAVADGNTDFCIQYLNEKYRNMKAGAGIWDNAPVDLILSEANCMLVNDEGKPFIYVDPGHISQSSVTLVPGLDRNVMADILARQLRLHNLPKPMN